MYVLHVSIYYIFYHSWIRQCYACITSRSHGVL